MSPVRYHYFGSTVSEEKRKYFRLDLQHPGPMFISDPTWLLLEASTQNPTFWCQVSSTDQCPRLVWKVIGSRPRRVMPKLHKYGTRRLIWLELGQYKGTVSLFSHTLTSWSLIIIISPEVCCPELFTYMLQEMNLFCNQPSIIDID